MVTSYFKKIFESGLNLDVAVLSYKFDKVVK